MSIPYEDMSTPTAYQPCAARPPRCTECEVPTLCLHGQACPALLHRRPARTQSQKTLVLLMLGCCGQWWPVGDVRPVACAACGREWLEESICPE